LIGNPAFTEIAVSTSVLMVKDVEYASGKETAGKFTEVPG
jgi:hypothetical protein